jgi:hypothetical protein
MVAEGALPPPRKWHSRKLWLVSEIEAHLNEWPTECDEDENRWGNSSGLLNVPATNAGRLPISSSPDGPLQEYHDRIGFDPRTMDASETRRLQEAADIQWRASVPGSPLNKLEQKALLQFERHGAGVLVSCNAIKGLGLNTADRLEARGFIDIHFRSPDRLEGYVLTDAGLSATQALREALGK